MGVGISRTALAKVPARPDRHGCVELHSTKPATSSGHVRQVTPPRKPLECRGDRRPHGLGILMRSPRPLSHATWTDTEWPRRYAQDQFRCRPKRDPLNRSRFLSLVGQKPDPLKE